MTLDGFELANTALLTGRQPHLGPSFTLHRVRRCRARVYLRTRFQEGLVHLEEGQPQRGWRACAA